MIDEQKIKGDYAYKCKCGAIIQIDSEYKDFFSGRDEENEPTILTGECPKCNTTLIFKRNDIGKTVLPLYKKKFEFRWKDD